MQIRSKFKDYYDHISYLYSGGDPSIHYNRNRLVPLNEFGFSTNIPLDVGLRKLPYVNLGITNPEIFKWLVVCGKYYLLVGTTKDFIIKWELYNEAKHLKIVEGSHRGYMFIHNKKQNYLGEYSNDLLAVSKKVNAPVFCVNQLRKFEVESEIPVLSNIIGFPAYYPPEQLYQDIAYFMGNTIRPSPDTSPVPTITDKEKILQHGFDLKQSFRHRK